MYKALIAAFISLALFMSPSGSLETPQDTALLVVVESHEQELMEHIRASSVKVSDPQSGHGSGTCIMKADGGKTSFILTAAHLMEEWHAHGGRFVVTSPDKEGVPRTYLGSVVAYDADLDLCLIKVPNSPEIEMTLLSRLNDLSEGTRLWAAGFPAGIYPTHVTVGFAGTYMEPPWYHNGNEENVVLFHTAGIWFGNSGGALIDVKSGRMVGVNVRIGGKWGMPLGNRAYAVSAETIWYFLREHHFGTDNE